MSEQAQHLRILEAVLFAAVEPLDAESLIARLPDGAELPRLIEALGGHYAGRGVNLVEVGGRWALRTAPDLAPFLRTEQTVQRKLSRAGLETLAIIAYHQPVTRGEIEEIRGVSVSRGTIDALLEIGWIRPGRRRQTPGRPLTWLTTDPFLSHFSLASLEDLPGMGELKAAGLLDKGPALGAIGPIAGGVSAEEGADAEEYPGEEPEEEL